MLGLVRPPRLDITSPPYLPYLTYLARLGAAAEFVGLFDKLKISPREVPLIVTLMNQNKRLVEARGVVMRLDHHVLQGGADAEADVEVRREVEEDERDEEDEDDDDDEEDEQPRGQFPRRPP